MAKLYRFLSGSISRPNAAGVMEIHKAPFDFVPTESELAANKWRMQFIREIDETSGTEIPAAIPANTPKKDNVCNLSIKEAGLFVNTLDTDDALDIAMFQENDNKPKPRKAVMAAIQSRRDYLAFVAQRTTKLSGSVPDEDIAPGYSL